MQDSNEKNTASCYTPRQHAQPVVQAGRLVGNDTDRFPVDALLPCTTYPRGSIIREPPPDHEIIPDLAAMSDGERRLWMAPRRFGAVLDQLPQARRAAVGSPSGDLQPGTQRKQAASSGSARLALESVVLAQGATSLPNNPHTHISTAPFRFVTIHACDRQTDRRTKLGLRLQRKTALAYARAVKTSEGNITHNSLVFTRT